MRFVSVKTAEKQASSMAFKVRDLLVRQHTQTINALRGHLMEFGLIVPQGIKHILSLKDLIATHPNLPEVARILCDGLLAQVVFLSEKIAVLEKELRTRARQDDLASRLMTIPGVGAICATAIEALAPSAETFSKGRDFAAWIGLLRKRGLGGRNDQIIAERGSVRLLRMRT